MGNHSYDRRTPADQYVPGTPDVPRFRHARRRRERRRPLDETVLEEPDPPRRRIRGMAVVPGPPDRTAEMPAVPPDPVRVVRVSPGPAWVDIVLVSALVTVLGVACYAVLDYRREQAMHVRVAELELEHERARAELTAVEGELDRARRANTRQADELTRLRRHLSEDGVGEGPDISGADDPAGQYGS
jgi:hypothetical protein